MDEKPKRVSVGEISYERSERIDSPSTSEIKRFVGLEHFDQGNLDIERFGDCNDLGSAMKRCVAGDTLIARRNVYLKRASRCNFDALCSGDAIVLREKGCIVPGFLSILFNSDSFWKYASSNADGTMSKRLSVSHLRSYEFWLPSVENQKKIVDLIWMLENLKTKLATELKNLDLLIKSQFIEMFSSYMFDKSSYCSLGDVCIAGPQNGIYKKDEGEDYNANIAKMGQLFDGDHIDYSQSFDKIHLDDTDMRFLLNEGDIIFGRRSLVVKGAGKCSWVGKLKINTVFESSLIRFTPDVNKIHCRFINQWFQTPLGEESIRQIRTVVTVAGVRGSDLIRLMIPVPPINKQLEYVSFLEQVDKSKLVKVDYSRNCGGICIA